MMSDVCKLMQGHCSSQNYLLYLASANDVLVSK